jgi:Bax protein
MRILASVITLALTLGAAGFPKEYYAIKNSKEQRQAFGRILRPMVEAVNQGILEGRAFVKDFFDTYLPYSFRDIPSEELLKLAGLRKKYRVEALYDKQAYLKRIDVIPISLALAQGALESGWGKSRFVREANNIFGHWTWGDVGLIPRNREEGKTHRIRIFKTLTGSVRAYALNLNRHYAYELFRNARENARDQGKVFGGFAAAETMLYYSEMREKYVKMLKKTMEDNHFPLYDKATVPQLLWPLSESAQSQAQ